MQRFLLIQTPTTNLSSFTLVLEPISPHSSESDSSALNFSPKHQQIYLSPGFDSAHRLLSTLPTQFLFPNQQPMFMVHVLSLLIPQFTSPGNLVKLTAIANF